MGYLDQVVTDEITISNEVSKHIITENKKAIVSLKIDIGDNTLNFPFCISLEMIASFHTEDNMTEERFNKLLDINAPAVLLSYARPIIAIITSQSGYPTLNLPFVNFTDH